MAASFYATACGTVSCRLLRARLVQFWPALSGQSVLGLGYAVPYLRAWQGEARCVAATPAQAGPTRAGCTVDEAALPFPDLSFDRVLLIHGLEGAENARALLREVWRVLRDDGRLLLVAPNRVGVWAHVESTPFGHGQPYSRGQVERLLAANLFRAERSEFALFMPPTRVRLVLRAARLWERAGQWLAPTLGGVTITEAVKDTYAAVPLKPARQRRVLLSEAA